MIISISLNETPIDHDVVSIIIRTKNEERWIEHCLASIKDQTIKDLVVGSRFLNEGDIQAGAFSYIRRLGSNLATFYTKKLLGIKIGNYISKKRVN